MNAIVAEGLVKHFDDVRAVDGIDLDTPEGAIFGFLGANGSGKTTTIRMLTTLLRPTAGTAKVDGLDIVGDARAVRRRIGVAFQEAGLDDLQSGRELLTLQARLFGLCGSTLRGRVEELLAPVDLEDAANRAVGGYSGGMKRRLDLALPLVHRPSIIFLGEPTTVLEAQRSLVLKGREGLDLLRGGAAILGFVVVSFTLTFLALRGRPA